MPVRYISGFKSASGISAASGIVTFPTARYEWETSQDFVNASVPLTGISYEYDQLGTAAGMKENAIERVRFLIVGAPSGIDTTLRDIQDTCFAIGKGLLVSDGGDGTTLVAAARIQNLPVQSVTVENLSHLPVMLSFIRFSDWAAE